MERHALLQARTHVGPVVVNGGIVVSFQEESVHGQEDALQHVDGRLQTSPTRVRSEDLGGIGKLIPLDACHKELVVAAGDSGESRAPGVQNASSGIRVRCVASDLPVHSVDIGSVSISVQHRIVLRGAPRGTAANGCGSGGLVVWISSGLELVPACKLGLDTVVHVASDAVEVGVGVKQARMCCTGDDWEDRGCGKPNDG